MKWLLTFFLSSFSLGIFAKNQVLIHVQLNPAGSFEALSEKIEGDLFKKKDTLIADKLILNIETLKTGIDLRDEHLWKHMSAGKYKHAILTNLVGKNGMAKAFLEVAGVKRPLNMQYKEDGKLIKGTFKVSAQDFKLPEAEYMGIGVDDEVIAEVNMEFKEK